jgi:glycerol-3-phosphate acyltransferase PlsY
MIARANGVDIFANGSGSSGATNVKRAMGKFAARVVFVLDFFKGLIPCLIMVQFPLFDGDLRNGLAMASLGGVVLGHSFSIFCKFRGGKGFASTMGGLLVIMPKSLVMGIFIWMVIFHATRMVSVASLCFSMSLLLTSYLFEYPAGSIPLALFLNVIIFWRHWENITRLANGTEYKFEKQADG